MAEYKIYFKESVEKDFRAIPNKDLRKFSIALRRFQKIRGRQATKNLQDKKDIASAKDYTGSSILFKIKSLPFGW